MGELPTPQETGRELGWTDGEGQPQGPGLPREGQRAGGQLLPLSGQDAPLGPSRTASRLADPLPASCSPSWSLPMRTCVGTARSWRPWARPPSQGRALPVLLRVGRCRVERVPWSVAQPPRRRRQWAPTASATGATGSEGRSRRPSLRVGRLLDSHLHLLPTRLDTSTPVGRGAMATCANSGAAP